MADVERRPPFYERRGFQGAVAVVGLVAAVWALVGAPRLWDVVADLFSSDLPSSNTEIILDTSAAMDAPFGAGTKLDAAADAVGDFALPFRNEGLALRRLGSDCEETGELLVDFGEDHGDEVGEAATEQQPEGPPNLGRAVIAAIDDFADSERFPDSDSRKRVVVFTGTGRDDCLENAPDEIRRELDRSGIDAVFRLVGVKVSGKDRERLLNLTNALGHRAEVVFADTPEELDDAATGAEEPEGPTGPSGPSARAERPADHQDHDNAAHEYRGGGGFPG